MSATERSFKSDSDFIEEVTYHVKQKELVVRMKGGKVYHHPAVTLQKFQNFADATSQGNFYNLEIKDQHPYVPSKEEIKRNEDAFNLLNDWVGEINKNGRVVSTTEVIKKAREITSRKV